MRKMYLALLGAAALTGGTAANAALTVSDPSGTGFTLGTPDNTTIPNKVTFDTTSNLAGVFTSAFKFTEDMTSLGNFSLTTSTLGASITLAEVLNDSTLVIIQSATGSGPFLTLSAQPLLAGTTYQFSYTSNLPTGGGSVSGNASFYAVPEPATWMLMLLGFGGIGFSMRRRSSVLAQIA